MNNNPLVSVLINNYNYADFLADAIDSSLSQTYNNIEIIVVDDGSRDNSLEIADKYRDSIIIVPKENGGQGSAFNAGFKASKGEIICFLDSDDYFYPEKVKKVVSIFLKNLEVEWLFHDLEDVSREGKLLNSTKKVSSPDNPVIDFRQQFVRGEVFPYFLPATTGLCFRRDLLAKTLPMPEQIRISADNFLRLTSIHISPGYLLIDKLAVHRIHGTNAFEARTDTEIMRAETNIKTSYYLRKNFPGSKAFADRLCAHAAGNLLGILGIRQISHVPELGEYFKYFLLPFPDLKYIGRLFYNYAKSSQNSLRS